ncbi:hypothetical protein [Variovorax sp. J22R115]|uniref:hypothetical protein n=1 Tax=Variovorax sp. J22R115 TaxID=3053509 RepID=UPI0025776349|nr:hypothetical protein [Variovorax sp. J22R115]MDM0052013.1 hypothetical protein [Variovorax sp. J22R115]
MLEAIGGVLGKELQRRDRRLQALEARLDELMRSSGGGVDLPTWTLGVHRVGSRVQHYLGQCFEAQVDTAEEPGTGMDWRRLGTGGFRVAQPWSEGRSYAIGDLVVKDFSTFITTASGMALLAARGPRGEPGTPGVGAQVLGLKVSGSRLVLTVRDARGEHQLAVDLFPLLEQLGEAVRDTLRIESAER